MGTLILSEMKKKASGFLHEKYKTARMVLTDVSQAELLAEDATNDEPGSPDAKTMTRIAEASFEVDDYWRIVDVLHGRLYSLDRKQWRQSYKALILLEFLLTHGPEDFAEEFQCDKDLIRELGSFKHIDERGFDWGASMQKISERIVKLLNGGAYFMEARLKALKITKEIKGFGNLLLSPSSSSSTPSSFSSSGAPGTSFGSFSVNSTPTWSETEEFHKHYQKEKSNYFDDEIDENMHNVHLWDWPIEDKGSLLNAEEEKREDAKEKLYGFVDGIRSTLGNVSSPWKIRSLSDAGKKMKKSFDRQFSMGN